MKNSHFITANSLKRQGKLDDAISYYRIVLENNPTFCWSYYQLGEILEQTSELNEAVDLYSKCIELNPNSSWFHYKLGLALSKLEKQSDAVSNLEKAFRINPLPLYKKALDNLILKSNKLSIASVNPKIDFGIIGFPKCGTTSLYWNLHKHSGICLVPGENLILQLREQASLLTPNAGQIVGFKTPNFIYHNDIISELIDINPNMKMIVCLRNPVSWLFSFYQYRRLEIQQNREWLQPQLAKNPNLRNVTFDMIVYKSANLLGVHKDKGCFVKFMEQLMSLVSSKQILITFLENVKQSPKQEYQRILSFLNLPEDQIELEKLDSRNVNKEKYESKENYEPQLAALHQYYSESVHQLNNFLIKNFALKVPDSFFEFSI